MSRPRKIYNRVASGLGSLRLQSARGLHGRSLPRPVLCRKELPTDGISVNNIGIRPNLARQYLKHDKRHLSAHTLPTTKVNDYRPIRAILTPRDVQAAYAILIRRSDNGSPSYVFLSASLNTADCLSM